MNVVTPLTDAVLKIGEVSEIDGRKIYIKVVKNKNASDLLFEGDILKNVSANSYIEIRKGFLSIIGKVDGEKIVEAVQKGGNLDYDERDKNKRYLTVSLSGYIDNGNKFVGGTKELPLIGNEAFILTRDKLHLVHSLVSNENLQINIASTDHDDFDITFPVDGLFNSHIAIFGNTGSGKSNTLASLYQALLKTLEAENQDQFKQNTRFLLFDFNGEYTGPNCITEQKHVFNLSTRDDAGDKIPVSEDSLLDTEILSILADATEKTQKPFLKRAIAFYNHVHRRDPDNPEEYFRNILRKRVENILQMSDKIRADLLLDFTREILPTQDGNGDLVDIGSDLDWHNVSSEFKFKKVFLKSHPDRIPETAVYRHVANFSFGNDLLTKVICFLYLQLISDVLSNRAQNEHIAPAINKLKSKKKDIDKLFDTSGEIDLWRKNFVVVNLERVNLEMKKTVPLLLSKKIYSDHKDENNTKSLNLIIDEAHNILSKESFREAESWKDYRLETFEEIIKEGRKFGVFVTISSQRPNDISATITSQAHNYFIHRLINQKDLATISSAVSYIDKITEESIPSLPTGTCIFSGTASQMPLKLNIKKLEDEQQPQSHTLKFSDVVQEEDWF